MPASRLSTIRVEKPWGRHRLWPGFADPAPERQPVGEIWFDAGGAPDLLVKYLFTSERLSIQCGCPLLRKFREKRLDLFNFKHQQTALASDSGGRWFPSSRLNYSAS